MQSKCDSIKFVLKDGEYKKIFSNDRVTIPQITQEVAPFHALYSKIWEIVYSNTDVQKIRKSKIQWE